MSTFDIKTNSLLTNSVFNFRENRKKDRIIIFDRNFIYLNILKIQNFYFSI